MPRATQTSPPALTGYWQRSQEPLQALWFLLPLLVLYEVGLFRFGVAGKRPIIAETVLQKFFQVFGVDNPTLSYHLPAVVVMGVLIVWHLTRRDAWTFDFRTYLLMLIESVLLALPLMVFGLALFRGPHAATATTGDSVWQIAQVRVLESIGAGVYEEFVYRVIGIALLHALLVDVLALPQKWGAFGAIAVTSVVFSALHFDGTVNPFHWGKFIFFVVAGVFFAIIYLLRGFGIAAGCHAAYDIYIFLIEMARSSG